MMVKALSSEERIARAACVQAAATLVAASMQTRELPLESQAAQCTKIADLIYNEVFAAKHQPAPRVGPGI